MTPVDIESVDPLDASVRPVSPAPDDGGNTCQDPVDPPQVDSGGSSPKIPTPNTPHKAWLPPSGSEPSGRNERRRSSGISELYGKFQTGVLDKHATIPNKWASLIQMIVFFLIGLGLSLAHCCYYWKLNGKEVGASWRQEEKLRVGTALSFLAQLALTASIWKAYTQWLWRAVERKTWTANGLDKAFGADTAPSSLISWEFIRNFRLGAIIAFFAWCLILPAFFTPAALYIYQSTKKVTALENVPNLAISNSSVGHEFAYSPPWNDGETADLDTTRVFMGPRSVLTLLASASSSIGEILPIEPPSNHSTYSLDFYGPSVRCQDANETIVAIINKRLEERMTIRKDTARQIESAYFAFVPAINGTGDVIALSAPRFQDPSRATNELWMTFQRYIINQVGVRERKRIWQVCRLYNATYNLELAWDGSVQTVTGDSQVREVVNFPSDKSGVVSDMANHAYAAFLWTMTDQLVGSLGWFQEETGGKDDSDSAPQFGVMESPIRHTSILGSSDLDVYFDFRSIYKLYANEPPTVSDQRQQDKKLARNATLPDLIEQLSFNMTVSLLHNRILSRPIERPVTRWNDINKYGYVPTSLFIPYGLANLVTLIAVLLGLASFWHYGPRPDKSFQHIAILSRNGKIVKIINETGSEQVDADKISMSRRGSLWTVRRESAVTDIQISNKEPTIREETIEE